jgi:translation initiation factor IF-2
LQTKEPKESKATKVRVFNLAKELKLETTDVIEYCKELGYTAVKNQLNGLEPDQVEAVKDRAKKGPPKTHAAAQTPVVPKAAKPVLPPPSALTNANKIRTIPPPKPAVSKQVPVAPAPEPEPEPTPAAEIEQPVAVEVPVEPEPQVAAPAGPNLAAIAGGAGKRPTNLSGRSAPRPSIPASKSPAATPSAAPVAPPVAPTATPPKPEETVPDAPAASTAPPATAPKPPAISGNPTRAANPPTIRPPSTQPPRQGMPMQVPSNRPQGGGGGMQRPGGPRPGVPGGGQPRQGGPQSSGPRSTSMPHRQHGPGGSPHGPPKPGGPSKPPVPPRPTGSTKLTPEQIAKLRELSNRGQRIDAKKLTEVMAEPKPGTPAGPGGPPRPGDDKPGGRTFGPGRARTAAEEDEDKKKGIGAVTGRDARAKGRATTGRDRKPSTDRNSVIIGAGGSVEMIDQQAGSRRGPRAALISKMKRRQQQQVVKKEGPIELVEPITVRSLSEAIGMKTGELGKRLLKETNQLYGNNSVVGFDVAELIAIEKGMTLILKKQATAESRLLDEYEKRAQEVDPALLQPRAPVVTIMGHVDHGKTSLLDKIRQEFGVASDVVSTEAGGITQVIRAWQVAKDEKRITFLDTPGHEAFTKMRARGAKVTDICVIVVAATDGVMPQTEEAIAHAKAADVDVIVAINKVDMPNANVDKTRRQLYSLNLLPDDMGGDVPFVETSAVTGQGVADLLESILLVAELADLKADPSHPASGTCLEAYQDADEGVKATLIVQQGTLRKGDVVLCGATFGRVRAMYNDLGRSITEAGPSTPVKITGLDDVPEADDPFYAVEDVGTAREIAEKRKVTVRGAGLNQFAPVSLENLAAIRSKAKITELKVILKAEARGSVEAIKKELEKLIHDEVRCRVLHAGIGAITESDVILALTSPDDTMVIGFNVTADDPALKLAEARGVSIREFDIIYKLTDAVKSALEGKLKPVEEIVHLGRAIIRETFKISKVGTIAGCYVTSGTIERSARVRVIRNGVVIFPSGEKVVGLDNLKRFKDDVKEVREGFECGMKITGFDDLKVDDVIEAFKIEIRYRTL